MTAPGSAFPVTSSLSGTGGELVQSLTYREAYAPAPPSSPSPIYDPPDHRLGDAPELFRQASGAAWALVSIAAAGCTLLVLVLLVIRLAGWLA